MILHICPREVWEAVGTTYAADTLATQGFIHLSTEKQVAVPATALFRGRDDLLLLVIDEAKLPTPLTWEEGDPPSPELGLFPHLYAALPVAAVVAVHDYRPGPDGSFGPPDLPEAP